MVKFQVLSSKNKFKQNFKEISLPSFFLSLIINQIISKNILNKFIAF